ncbi:MAG TPA: hypothetical protein VHI13_00325 [Candidatus Kapabacteria bacterium]|nr:hypothetical protein [Candidatus Kapabacteria bacterium]
MPILFAILVGIAACDSSRPELAPSTKAEIYRVVVDRVKLVLPDTTGVLFPSLTVKSLRSIDSVKFEMLTDSTNVLVSGFFRTPNQGLGAYAIQVEQKGGQYANLRPRENEISLNGRKLSGGGR